MQSRNEQHEVISPDVRHSASSGATTIFDSAVANLNRADAFHKAARRCSSSLSRAAGWRRGAVMLVTTVLLLATPLTAHAQKKVLQIGALAIGPRYIPAARCGQTDHTPGSGEARRETVPYYILGLLDGLQKLKYVEDRPDNTRAIGRRFALDMRTGTLQQVEEFAREFAAKRVDIIVAVATSTVGAAQRETRGSGIPILMTGVSQPVQEGFVQSLARPGGLITGVSHQLTQGSGKRVELFKEMLPGLKRLMTIRKNGYAVAEASMVEVRAAADRLNIEVLDRTVANRAELQAVLASVRRDEVDGIMILPDSLIISNVDLVLETSLAQRVPAFGLQDFMAEWGALAAYGPSAFQAGSRVAGYVDKISRGAKPGDLAVEPLDPTFVINMKTAECLGASLPLEVLRQADRVLR